jgi:hypothetical protein
MGGEQVVVVVVAPPWLFIELLFPALLLLHPPAPHRRSQVGWSCAKAIPSVAHCSSDIATQGCPSVTQQNPGIVLAELAEEGRDEETDCDSAELDWLLAGGLVQRTYGGKAPSVSLLQIGTPLTQITGSYCAP